MQGLMWFGLALCAASLIWFTASPPGDRQGEWLITVAVLLLIMVEVLYRTRIRRAKRVETEDDPERPTGTDEIGSDRKPPQMSRVEKTSIVRTLPTAAVNAVLLFAFGTVLYRLTDGDWSVGKPLSMAIMITAIVAVCTCVAAADKSSKWTAKKNARTTEERRSSQRTILIGVLTFSALTLVLGLVLVVRDLNAGRGVGMVTYVAALLLIGAMVVLTRAFQARRPPNPPTTQPDQHV